MIVVYGPDSVMTVSSRGFARLMVQNDAVHSLESSGDPAALRATMNRAESLCRGDTLCCVVDDTNPNRDRLLKLYRKFGFSDVGRILKRHI